MLFFRGVRALFGACGTVAGRRSHAQALFDACGTVLVGGTMLSSVEGFEHCSARVGPLLVGGAMLKHCLTPVGPFW
jgi:hypothetical protein